MESAPQTTRTQPVALWRSFFAATAATLTVYAIRKALIVSGQIDSGLLNVWLFAVGVFLISGCLIGVRLYSADRQFQNSIQSAAVAALAAAGAGIAAGVVVWAMVEDLIFKRLGVYPIYEEHNLFPLEIAVLWMLAIVPLLLGMCLGCVFAKRLAINR